VNPLEWDLSEACEFARLCLELGVKILNLSAGSPYYTPHIQRPAAYPPSDGYQPPEDPLIGVARQIQAVRTVRQFLQGLGAPSASMLVAGCGYSYLQEYLPHVAQYVLRQGWADLVGLGRMILAYPGILADATEKGALETKAICRTFSDCTTAPRNGLVSGCYPLDKYYAAKPEALKLKEVKRRGPTPT
jgi:2,4-dienoyl-CoA reductase-like NADH-dependent reductase (Old Yellow Enzyme family)